MSERSRSETLVPADGSSASRRHSTIGTALLALVTALAWWQSRPGMAEKGSEFGPAVRSPNFASRVRSFAAPIEASASETARLTAALGAHDLESRRDAITRLARAGDSARPFVRALRPRLDDIDSYIRGQAASTLGRIDRDSPETAAALARLLRDPHSTVRVAASAALCEMGMLTVPAVLPLLSDSDSNARLECIQVLLRLRDYSDTTTAALRRATNDQHPGVREGAAVALLINHRAELPEVIRWIHDASPRISDAALANLPGFGAAAAEAIPELVARLEAPPPAQLPRLLFALQSLDRQAAPAIPVLLRLLNSPVEYDIGEILATLIEIGAAPSVVSPRLVELLDDESPRLVNRAAGLLTRIDPAMARQQGARLAARIDDDRAVSMTRALAGLRGLGVHAAGAVPRLVELLQDDDVDRREQVAGVLARIGPPAAPAVPAIAALLDSERTQTRASVAMIEAAGAIGAASAPIVPCLMALIGAPDGPENPGYRNPSFDRARCAALVALAQIGARDADYRAQVSAALASGALSRWVAALQALAIVGEPDAELLPVVLAALHHPDSSVRVTAAQSIVDAAGGNARVVLELSRLLEDRDPEIRAIAAASLGRLGPSAASAVPALEATRSVRDNYLPIVSSRGERGRRMPVSAYYVESRVPFRSVAQAVEFALVRIVPEGSAVLR